MPTAERTDCPKGQGIGLGDRIYLHRGLVLPREEFVDGDVFVLRQIDPRIES